MVVCPTAQSAPFSTSRADTGAPQAGLDAVDIDNRIKDAAKPQDIMVVELIGLTAAAVAAAAAIRGIRGSSERARVPVALILLKLPTGAITAFLGLLLMRVKFTRLVDRQGQTVLDSVNGADKPQPSPSPR